jgi:hypothetical protein
MDKFIKTSLLITSLTISIAVVFTAPNLFNKLSAEELESTNYKIRGAVIDSAGEPLDSTNYSAVTTVGEFAVDIRNNSTNYQIRPGSVETFIANTPKISCLEATTDGSSQCTTGPTYLNSNGMVRVCGPSGCYDRARVEIDTQNNPSDTLYAIQISTDNFSTDIRYIDGVTNEPKPQANKDLNDYRSKSDWESISANIQGLRSNTEYSVRVTALQGDFTESSPSPTQTVTTAHAIVTADIDIADESGSTTETAPPYQTGFTGGDGLFQGGTVRIAPELIWLDSGTNAVNGLAMVHEGVNGSLYSSSTTGSIPSGNLDLRSTTEGFGIQHYDYSGTGDYELYETGSGNGELAEILVESDYNGSDDTVGEVATSFLRSLNSHGPIHSGRSAFYVKARASSSTPAATDYQEEITFVIVGRY